MRSKPLLALLIGVSSANVCTAQIIYDNSQGNLFTASAAPRYAMDDIHLSADEYFEIDKIRVGFAVAGSGGAADFDILVRYWDEVDFFPMATPSGLPINRGFLGSAIIPIRGVDNGFYSTGWVDIPNIITFDGKIGAEVSFWNPGTAVLHGNAKLTAQEMANFSRRATHLFAGGPVEIGNSEDVYWRDVDGNGQFDPSDQRNFGGYPNLANFYHGIQAVPEPSTLAVTLLGVIATLRRKARKIA